MLKFSLILLTLTLYIFAQDNIKLQKLEILKELNSTLYSGNTQKIYNLYKKLAKLYAKNGEYYKSVEYYKLALKLYLSIKEQTNQEKIAIYKNIAFCYKKIGNNFKTFKYTYKAVKLANKTYGKNSKITKKLDGEIKEIQSRLIASSIY